MFRYEMRIKSILPITEMWRSLWRNLHHWLLRKLSFWQLSVQSMMKISSKWRHFRFSAPPGLSGLISYFHEYFRNMCTSATLELSISLHQCMFCPCCILFTYPVCTYIHACCTMDQWKWCVTLWRTKGTCHNSSEMARDRADSGVGVTKLISSVPLFSKFFTIVKTDVCCWISGLYLTGVAAAQLRGHLSNMNVI